MTAPVPRMRMVAGPNGSGKSTLNGLLRPDLFGVYVNADDIERQVRETGGTLDLRAYGVHAYEPEVLMHFTNSRLLEVAGLSDAAKALHFWGGRLDFRDVPFNAYFAAVAAGFIRIKLLVVGASFTFETVMSSPDKLALLRDARARGYRTYLYYVATDDPTANVLRVRQRVRRGGHAVPEDKIVSRYHRSLALLADAVRLTDRAYVWDNSGASLLWLAEVTGGRHLELRTEHVPQWFRRALLDAPRGPRPTVDA